MTDVIRLEGVTLRYRVPRERIRSIKEYAIRRVQRRIVYDDFEALHAVDLNVAAGERVGVVGRNGAGKSTLFRVISRVLPPGEGRVYVAGRIAPILELGLGFHGELTGRENVMLQGALLGFSRAETRRRLDRIVAWAELEEFIDAPIRTFSTGMSARLAFAVATDVDPDILLVDEALSVGDEKFQRKCRDRMEGLRARGKTFMLVSHSPQQIYDNCERAIWLHHGRIVRDGPVLDVIAAYHEWSLGETDAVTPAV
ncbi:MAG TPA: ABC transporter ATP-binding protein [Thermoanaerobaculia bacterium]|nr:ABC transporter ATP-binding protein [Thermoanaerobaculia bacterium]